MENKLKSKTRLASIQLVTQQLLNKENIETIKSDFDKYYRNTKLDKNLDKVQYNINFLSKLIDFYKKTNYDILSKKIDEFTNFDRRFEKWDIINQAIILMAMSEINNSDESKTKIILNDYIEISKSFVSIKETKLINSILDKLINEKK